MHSVLLFVLGEYTTNDVTLYTITIETIMSVGKDVKKYEPHTFLVGNVK